MPMPDESLKETADCYKWVAGVSTLLIATSGTPVVGKLHGIWLWPYYGSLLVLIVSISSTEPALATLSYMVMAFEQGSADLSHTKLVKMMTQWLHWQNRAFHYGLALF